MAARFDPFKDKAGKWRWCLIDGNNRKVATSGEAFSSRSSALRAARNVKATAPIASIPSAQQEPANLLADLLDRSPRARVRRTS